MQHAIDHQTVHEQFTTARGLQKDRIYLYSSDVERVGGASNCGRALMMQSIPMIELVRRPENPARGLLESAGVMLDTTKRKIFFRFMAFWILLVLLHLGMMLCIGSPH